MRLLLWVGSRAGHWLIALPIGACGLWLDDEAIRIMWVCVSRSKFALPVDALAVIMVLASWSHGRACRRDPGSSNFK